MKQSRFSEQQIAFILHQAEEGVAVEDVCCKASVSIQTYYRWRKKYGGLMPSELKRLNLLEEENTRLKELVADLSLDKAMLQDVVKRNYEACSGPGAGRVSSNQVTGSASGVPVVLFASIVRPTTTGIVVPSRPVSASVFASCLKPASDTAIGASRSAATGGTDHQPQTHPASVSRGGPAIAEENAEAEGIGEAAGGSRRGYGRQ